MISDMIHFMTNNLNEDFMQYMLTNLYEVGCFLFLCNTIIYGILYKPVIKKIPSTIHCYDLNREINLDSFYETILESDDIYLESFTTKYIRLTMDAGNYEYIKYVVYKKGYISIDTQNINDSVKWLEILVSMFPDLYYYPKYMHSITCVKRKNIITGILPEEFYCGDMILQDIKTKNNYIKYFCKNFNDYIAVFTVKYSGSVTCILTTNHPESSKNIQLANDYINYFVSN